MIEELKSAVSQAFDAVSDLAIDVTFTTKQTSGFDFSTGGVTSTTTSKTIKCIVYEKTKQLDGRLSEAFSNKIVKVLFKEEVDMNLYNQFTFSSKTYSIEKYDEYSGLYVVEGRQIA